MQPGQEKILLANDGAFESLMAVFVVYQHLVCIDSSFLFTRRAPSRTIYQLSSNENESL